MRSRTRRKAGKDKNLKGAWSEAGLVGGVCGCEDLRVMPQILNWGWVFHYSVRLLLFMSYALCIMHRMFLLNI